MTPPPENNDQVRRKAGLGQVAATMFWGLLMVGRKGTWERDGISPTPLQLLAGAIITTLLVILLLVSLARLAVS
ncbi:MAG: DUF2970 domain-containing protein [Burkholderiales bacterium]|nr:DUF2970 domain-containing protein [Burkholderiales bacterium]